MTFNAASSDEEQLLLTPPILNHPYRPTRLDSELGATSRQNQIESTTTTRTASLHSANRVPTTWTREKIKSRLKYYIPVLNWLPNYNIGNDLLSDAMAGLTVAFLLIPGGLAYSSLVQVPPVYGLLTGFIPLVVYALLGTSRQLALGPEALVSTLVGSAISQLNGHPITPGIEALPDISDRIAENIATASLLTLMVGLWTSVLGVFRLGFLDSVISRPLLRGFVTAIAVVVDIEMLATLFGLPKVESETGGPASTMEKLGAVLANISKIHTPTLMISICSVVFLLGMKAVKARFSKRHRWLSLVPEILLLVALSTALSAIFRWDLAGVAVLREVQGGFVPPNFPKVSLGKIKVLLLSSILIAVIGFVEAIVGARTAAARHHYSISPNRELVALGMANLIGCLFGSWPCFGSLGRTVVNDAAGARTQMAGFITGLFTFITSILLLPYFYFLPRSVCSSIIVVAVATLVELEDVHFIWKLRAWNDLGLLLLTFCTTVFISIEAGTLISVGTSLLLVVKESTKTRISILGMTHVVDTATGMVKFKFRSIQEQRAAERIQGCLLIRIEEGLFFGNSSQLQQLIRRVEAHGELGVHPGEAPRKRVGKLNGVWAANATAVGSNDSSSVLAPGQEAEITSLVLDIENMTFIDASATQVLLELVKNYQSRDIIICFVKLREACKTNFIRSGIYELVGRNRFFIKARDALQYLSEMNFIPPIPALAYSKPPSAMLLQTVLGHQSDSNSSTSYHSVDVDQGSAEALPSQQQEVPRPPLISIDTTSSFDNSNNDNTRKSGAASSSSTKAIPFGSSQLDLYSTINQTGLYSSSLTSEVMNLHDSDSDGDEARTVDSSYANFPGSIASGKRGGKKGKGTL